MSIPSFIDTFQLVPNLFERKNLDVEMLQNKATFSYTIRKVLQKLYVCGVALVSA